MHLTLALYVLSFVFNNTQVEQLQKDMAYQEAFRQQQRDYNNQLNQQVVTNGNNLTEVVHSQGIQNDRMSALESRINVLYAIGDAGIWGFGIVVTLFVYYDNKKAKQNTLQHAENQSILKSLDKRVEQIEFELNIQPSE